MMRVQNLLPNWMYKHKIINVNKRKFFGLMMIIVMILCVNFFALWLIKPTVYLYKSSEGKLILASSENIYASCMKMVLNPHSKNHHRILINDPEVIILVDSKVDDYESRCAIRAVWSHYSTKKLSHIMSYVVIFQLGYKNQAIKTNAYHEQELYGDLIIHNNIPEVYSNVGRKLFASFELIKSLKNPSLKYIVKTDDDVYVGIHNYLLHLKSMLDVDVDYEGLIFYKMMVNRDKNNKNYEPSRTAVGKIYPPYCTGYGYYIKATKLDCLIRASKSHENLQNGDTNVGHLIRFCNTTMKNNPYYSESSYNNQNLADGIKLFKKNHFIYFLHGIRKYDQLIFDRIFQEYQMQKKQLEKFKK